MKEELRAIPSISEVLLECQDLGWAKEYSRDQLVDAIRGCLEDVRGMIKQEKIDLPQITSLTERIRDHLQKSTEFSLTRVINATGVIVHTNLGRAPLSPQATEHLLAISGYSNLELDLISGQRGSRDSHLEKFLLQLVPAEACLVVNNNAAALLLILNTLAEGKEVLVSRGELVEIGGSFRLPEIMKKSGAILREIGTTNKTHLGDYRKAITAGTGMILVVHPSNFQIIGFTEKPTLTQLIQLGKEQGIPVIEDHGSGLLFDLSQFGIPDEPSVQERLKEGPDLICFSGDKILGGPQAGIICGKKALVERLRCNPMFRALRVDKMVYAALEATLLLYLKNQRNEIPVYRMLSQSHEELKQRAQLWADELQELLPDQDWSAQETQNYIGGGVAPMKGLSSFAVSLSPSSMQVHEVAQLLRDSHPAILGRIESDRLYFELRTIVADDQKTITATLLKILKKVEP